MIVTGTLLEIVKVIVLAFVIVRGTVGENNYKIFNSGSSSSSNVVVW